MPIAGIAAGIHASAGMMGLILGIYPPLLEGYQQFAFNLTPNKLPDLGTAVEMRYRKEIGDGAYKSIFKKSGIKNEYADNIYAMSKQLLSVGEYLTLWRRNEISDTELTDYLEKLRFNVDGIDLAKKVSEYFPSPADLVQFAVREVYSPAVVSKFGQMEDIPAKFITEAKRAGLPEEQANNFWAAHWALPGANQGFEMFHRNIINEEDLKMLLKSLDIMPFWRDMLIQLSYSPLTRVDVRRMHAMGILDDEGTEQAYKDRGYSPENAKNMLDFTKSYNAESTTGLTRASMINAYKKKLVDRSEVIEVFEQFGYSPDTIEFWLDLADLELELEEIAEHEADLLRQYRLGAITLSDLRRELDYQDVPAEHVEKVIQKEVQAVSQKVKLPTKGDLTDWLKLQIIDETIYSDSMTALGYRTEDITFYLTEFELVGDTSVRKFLGIKTYSRWLKGAIMTETQFRSTAGLMKIDTEDIERLVMEATE